MNFSSFRVLLFAGLLLNAGVACANEPSSVMPCTPAGWAQDDPALKSYLSKLDERAELLAQLQETSSNMPLIWQFVLDRQGQLTSSTVHGANASEFERLIVEHKAVLNFPALPTTFKDSAVCFRKSFNMPQHSVPRTVAKYGYVMSGKPEPAFVIPPQYDQAGPFIDGLAKVGIQNERQELEWFLINTQGQPVSERFDLIAPFRNNRYAEVRKNDLWGLLDHTGKVIVPPRYEQIVVIDEQLARFRKDGKVGLLALPDTIMVPAIYDNIDTPKDGVMRVWLDKKVGYLKTEGTLIFEPRYLLSSQPFSDDRAVIQDGNKNTLVLDSTGTIVFGPLEGTLSAFSEGYAVIGKDAESPSEVSPSERAWVYGMAPDEYTVKSSAKKYGYLSKAGQVVIPPQFDRAMPFKQGLATVALQDASEKDAPLKWGLIDTSGKFLLKHAYDHIGPFNEEGLATITLRERREGRVHQSKVGLVNRQGQVLLAPTYSAIERFSDGLAVVTQTTYTEEGVPLYSRKGYINQRGELVIPLLFSQASAFTNGRASVVYDVQSAQSKAGRVLIDKAGQEAEPLAVKPMPNAVTETLIPMRDNQVTRQAYAEKPALLPQQYHSNIITGREPSLPPKRMVPEEMTVTSVMHLLAAHAPPVGKKDVVVHVSDKRQPVALFLTAYNSCNWLIEVEPGVRLTQVIVGGYHPQTISSLPPSVKVFNYSTKTLSGAYVNSRIRTKAEYLNVLEKVKYLTETYPSTVQFAFNPSNFLVDGQKNITFPDPNARFDQSQVALHCSYSCTLAGLKVTKADPAYATRAYSSGKYYFEAVLELPKNWQGASYKANIGITSSPGSFLTFNFPREEGYAYGAFGPTVINGGLQPDGTIHRTQLKTGDVIGLAIDLDHHRMYFSLNGKWVNGTPMDRGSGMPVAAGLDYNAVVSTGTSSDEENEMWTVNFGKKPFRYPVPEGFRPYDGP